MRGDTWKTWNLVGGVAPAIAAWALLTAVPSSAEAQAAVTPCASLEGRSLPASVVALPSGGVRIETAVLADKGPGGALPEFCLVRGSVAMVDPQDPPIRFEVNLPTRWIGKAIQFGGGGFNGTVVTGLGQAPHVAADAPVPLAQGYMTYGGDSGHEGPIFDGRFGLNDQALANYGGEAVKRTHDAAFAVAQVYYGRRPRRSYHVGGSKGGQEGMVAAQRYGADYDGVVVYYPALENQAMVLSWYAMWKAAYAAPGAALNPADQRLLKASVLAVCDRLDGASDGVIADSGGCHDAFRPASLRCADGGEPRSTCLTDAQIGGMQVGADPIRFAFPMANGVRSIGPYPVFLGGDVAGTLFDPAGTDGSRAAYGSYAGQVIPFFDMRDPAYPPARFDPRKHRERVQRISALYDATDPNLDAFLARGGKLIVVQGTTDMLVAEPMTTAYVDRVRARYGRRVDGFVRYYVQPGFGHGGGDFAMTWDSLGALDRWVEGGGPPLAPVAVDAAPATRGRSMPLCRQPAFPVYAGGGNVRAAASFACRLRRRGTPNGARRPG